MIAFSTWVLRHESHDPIVIVCPPGRSVGSQITDLKKCENLDFCRQKNNCKRVPQILPLYHNNCPFCLFIKILFSLDPEFFFFLFFGKWQVRQSRWISISFFPCSPFFSLSQTATVLTSSSPSQMALQRHIQCMKARHMRIKLKIGTK